MSQFIGNKDDWNAMKPKIQEISIYCTIGTIMFALSSLLYLTQDPSKLVYFLVLTSSTALGLAFWALTVAAISK
jgi:hypothetical protein